MLKCLSNFWRTLEIPLTNYEINLKLTWSANCVVTNSTGQRTFAITGTKLYIPGVALSTKNNKKLLKKLKSGFKRTNNWNKHQSRVTPSTKNQRYHCLIDSRFQGLNRLFVL